MEFCFILVLFHLFFDFMFAILIILAFKDLLACQSLGLCLWKRHMDLLRFLHRKFTVELVLVAIVFGSLAFC